MEKETINAKLDQYKALFEKSKNVYLEIQKIIIIALNDLFFEEHLALLEKNKLIIDTIDCLKRSNLDMNFLFDLDKISTLFDKQEELNENQFFLLSKQISEILNDSLIIKREQNKIILDKINNENLKISKKNFEVEILADYMIDKISSRGIDVAIEMGCGKSYLTERLFECNENLVYVGTMTVNDLEVLKALPNISFDKATLGKYMISRKKIGASMIPSVVEW